MKRHHPLTLKQLFIFCLIFLFFTGTTLLLFCHPGVEEKYQQLTREFFQKEMTANTLNLHYTLANPADFGITDYTPTLPCYSKENDIQGQLTLENTLSALQKIDPDKLSSQDAYTRQLLTRTIENSLSMSSFPYYAEPLSPHSGMQSQLPILLAEYTFRSKKDVEDYLALLDQTDEYFASLLTYEQEKAAAGLLMASASLKKVIEQCDSLLTKEALKEGSHFLQTTFVERLQLLLEADEITSTEFEHYCSLNDRLLRTVMLPAYTTLADGLFLLMDEDISLSGLSSHPQGNEYYRYLLRAETGSYRDISEIKELLLASFQEEYQSIQTLAAEHPELADSLRNRKKETFPYHDASAMLQDLQRRMESDFPRFPERGSVSCNELTSLPSLTVKSVSPSLQDYSAPAFYLTAPLDDTDSNVIYINQKYSPSGTELYTTLAHEGYPGHLYQTVYCNRLFLQKKEDPIRQVLWYGGYLEGWALYVESLSYDYASDLLTEQGKDMDALGIQLEKHTRYLQLCLYSVLDIMIHYEDATPEQVAQVLEPLGILSASSQRAIYEYIVEEPCNYLKYYLGYLEISELKKEARTLWKENYNDLAFHTFFLESGPSDFSALHQRLQEVPIPQ